MPPVTGADLVRILGAIAAKLEAERDALCALDGEIGDGDHGVAMSLGFNAVRDTAQDFANDASPTDVLNGAARSFLSAVGASCGPLYATAFMRGAAAVKGRDALDGKDVAALINGMADGIAHRGKALPGDKTMLDVWKPAADAARAADGEPRDILRAAADVADAAAASTAAMEAKLGRAARLGARSVGHIDPGAASAAMIIRVIANEV